VRRIRAGWELTKKSWALLRGNPTLLRFPLYAALAALLVLAIVALPGLYLLDSGSTVGGIALVAVGVYGALFVTYYFSVGLAAAADEIFHGRLRIGARDYTITLPGGNLTCATAERFFGIFLSRPLGKLPRRWVVLPQTAEFMKNSSHHGFRIKPA
jgi:hypothetical protein